MLEDKINRQTTRGRLKMVKWMTNVSPSWQLGSGNQSENFIREGRIHQCKLKGMSKTLVPSSGKAKVDQKPPMAKTISSSHRRTPVSAASWTDSKRFLDSEGPRAELRGKPCSAAALLHLLPSLPKFGLLKPIQFGPSSLERKSAALVCLLHLPVCPTCRRRRRPAIQLFLARAARFSLSKEGSMPNYGTVDVG